MNIQIKHRTTGAVLFEGEFDNIKLALEAAVKQGADLRGADLGEADLGGAYLSGAYLRGAYLRGADLGGAYGILSMGYPGGWHSHAWLRDEILSIRIGCREFRYAEAIAYWTEKPNRLEQLAATEYARQIALARGWRIE